METPQTTEARLRAAVEPFSAHTAILVEGLSDELALRALARRRGRDLDAEGVAVLAMGGSKNIGTFLAHYGPQGLGVKLGGLCDAGEETDFMRGLERAGLGTDLTRDGMERLGFFVCVLDLEDELIRALGAPGVERVIEQQGELGSLRTFQMQPAWRGRPVEQQLRRFFGSYGSRKSIYPPLLIDALDLVSVPRPLAGVLGHLIT